MRKRIIEKHKISHTFVNIGHFLCFALNDSTNILDRSVFYDRITKIFCSVMANCYPRDVQIKECKMHKRWKYKMLGQFEYSPSYPAEYIWLETHFGNSQHFKLKDYRVTSS